MIRDDCEDWKLDWSSLFCGWRVSAELESCEVEVEVDLITDTGWEEARGALGPAEVTEAALVVAVVEVEGLEFAAGARETAGVGEAAEEDGAEAELEAELEAGVLYVEDVVVRPSHAGCQDCRLN